MNKEKEFFKEFKALLKKYKVEIEAEVYCGWSEGFVECYCIFSSDEKNPFYRKIIGDILYPENIDEAE